MSDEPIVRQEIWQSVAVGGLQPTINVTGVWLRTIGDRVQVMVELDGKEWRIVNDEQLHDGAKTIISHITEPAGIVGCPIWEPGT